MKKAFLCFLFAISLVVSSLAEVSPDLVLKTRKSGDYEERYFVYKDQPKIKQDQYVKLNTNYFLGTKRVVEMGSYEQNQKTGMWFDFHYYNNHSNMIRSFGAYVQGKKQGEWSSYFKNDDDDAILSPILQKPEDINQTSLFIPQSKREICILKIDTSNMHLMEIGQYQDDKKIGIWDYFSPEGALLHKYDHSLEKLIYNRTSPDTSIIYLGGIERFYNYFSFENLDVNESKGTNMVDYKVSESEYTLVESRGSIKWIKTFLKTLQSVPFDWVRTSEDNKKEYHLIFTVVRDPETDRINTRIFFLYLDKELLKKHNSDPDLLFPRKKKGS